MSKRETHTSDARTLYCWDWGHQWWMNEWMQVFYFLKDMLGFRSARIRKASLDPASRVIVVTGCNCVVGGVVHGWCLTWVNPELCQNPQYCTVPYLACFPLSEKLCGFHKYHLLTDYISYMHNSCRVRLIHVYNKGEPNEVNRGEPVFGCLNNINKTKISCGLFCPVFFTNLVKTPFSLVQVLWMGLY